MEMTNHDVHDMMEEMGICPTCHDHMPCGCEPEEEEFDMSPVSNVLTNAINRLNNLIG